MNLYVREQSSIGCPCCGGVLKPSRIVVDLDSNTIACGGKSWRCAPQVVEFIHAVVEAWPRAAGYDALAQALWGMTAWPADMQNVLAVTASRARKVLRHAGADVRAATGRGYRLEMTT